jgi:hypothetical protein
MKRCWLVVVPGVTTENKSEQKTICCCTAIRFGVVLIHSIGVSVTWVVWNLLRLRPSIVVGQIPITLDGHTQSNVCLTYHELRNLCTAAFNVLVYHVY